MLTGETVDKNVIFLLNLAPKSVLYMEIITAIELQALKLESGKKDTSAENLRQTVIKILSNTIGKKKTCSLSRPQRTALK